MHPQQQQVSYLDRMAKNARITLISEGQRQPWLGFTPNTLLNKLEQQFSYLPPQRTDIEQGHDWVQWAFPTTKESDYNKGKGDAANPAVRKEEVPGLQMWAAQNDYPPKAYAFFPKMMGMQQDHDGKLTITDKMWFQNFFTPNRAPIDTTSRAATNHNWLRATRAIESLALMGRLDLSVRLFNALMAGAGKAVEDRLYITPAEQAALAASKKSWHNKLTEMRISASHQAGAEHYSAAGYLPSHAGPAPAAHPPYEHVVEARPQHPHACHPHQQHHAGVGHGAAGYSPFPGPAAAAPSPPWQMVARPPQHQHQGPLHNLMQLMAGYGGLRKQ